MGPHAAGDDRLSRRGAAGCLVALTLAGLACSRPIAFSAADIAASKPLAGAPRGFFLGAATSAHQIEGGTHTDWTDWEKGYYPDGTPHVAGGATAARG
jgi:beta-glucosidase